MDKQKQIQTEELIGIIQGAVGGCATYWASLIAEEVLKYYQPKIPEDSIVLTKEEYEKLKNESIDKLFADDTFFKEEFRANEEYLRKRANRDYIKLVKGQARKETAEKFAEEVDKWKRKAIHYYNLAKSTGVYCIVDDDEICKELSNGGEK